MNKKFRAIGLDTQDKIVEFIDYIDDLEDTEEIKSDVYGFFEEESSYNENHIPAYMLSVLMVILNLLYMVQEIRRLREG